MSWWMPAQTVVTLPDSHHSLRQLSLGQSSLTQTVVTRTVVTHSDSCHSLRQSSLAQTVVTHPDSHHTQTDVTHSDSCHSDSHHSLRQLSLRQSSLTQLSLTQTVLTHSDRCHSLRQSSLTSLFLWKQSLLLTSATCHTRRLPVQCKSEDITQYHSVITTLKRYSCVDCNICCMQYILYGREVPSQYTYIIISPGNVQVAPLYGGYLPLSTMEDSGLPPLQHSFPFLIQNQL